MSNNNKINQEEISTNNSISELDSLALSLEDSLLLKYASRGPRPPRAPKPATPKPAARPAPAVPMPNPVPKPISLDRLNTLKAIPANTTPISPEINKAVRAGEIKIKLSRDGTEITEIKLSDRLKRFSGKQKNQLDQELANLMEIRKVQSANARASAAARRGASPAPGAAPATPPAPGAAPATPPAPGAAPAPTAVPGEHALEGGKFKFKLDDSGFIDPTSISVSDDVRAILANKPTMRERFSRDPATKLKVDTYNATRKRITDEMARIQSAKIAELKQTAVLNSNFERAKAALLTDIDRIVNKPGLLGTNKRKIVAGATVLSVVGLLFKTLSGNSVTTADPVKREILTAVDKKSNFNKENLLQSAELSGLISEFVSALNELKKDSNDKSKTLITSHISDLNKIKSKLDALSGSLNADSTGNISSMMSNLGEIDTAMSLYLPKINSLYKKLNTNELEEEASLAEEINEQFKSYISVIRQAKNSLQS
jgi:hypothetical protein